MPAPPLILLSFDVEEFDLPLEYGHWIEPAEQIRIGREGTRTLLDLLRGEGVRCTLFTTALFAEACPDLVREAAGAGHEIASHGLVHSGFEESHLAASRAVLERIAAAPVAGFRRARMAPTDPAAIARAGYAYDSSINPIWLPGRYNRFFAWRRVHRVALSPPEGEGRDPRWGGRALGPVPHMPPTAPSTLVEIPASATPLLRFPLFWLTLKNLPLWITKAATRLVLATDGYAALYFHPWELCDLSPYPLPASVKRLDADAYARRLRAYIRWLKTQGTITTYRTLAEQVQAGRRRVRVLSG